MAPRVSVILTSYNKAKYLSQAIESVLNQTFKDFELLIVDDNSDDGSWEIIQKFKAQDDRVKAFKTDLDPSGHSIDMNRYTHNINLMWPKAEGDYISYLCDDDWYLPTRLERMVEFLDFNPGVFVCYGIQQIANMEGDEVKMGPLRNSPKILYDAVCKVDHSSVMHRKECFGVVGGWPEEKKTWRIGDAYFWAKLQEHWQFVRIDKEPTDVHRYNELSVTYALDHKYPDRDDQGNHRTIDSGVDPGWEHEDCIHQD